MGCLASVEGGCLLNQMAAVQAALAHVLERDLADFAPSASLRDLGVDSIALVVTADVFEERNPGWLLPDEVLRDSRTVEDLALGVKSAA